MNVKILTGGTTVTAVMTCDDANDLRVVLANACCDRHFEGERGPLNELHDGLVDVLGRKK